MPVSPKRQREADGAANLAAALDYLTMGWPILALCPPDHAGMSERHLASCRSQGKRPWLRWAEFQPDSHGRLPTPLEVNEWWRHHPTSNVGLALGAVVRIDIEGPQARARLGEMSAGDLPDTLEFSSGRGDGTGEGWLYALPPDARLRTRREGLALGGELRLQALGAQTVLPPSRHTSGRLYAWKPGHGPKEIALAPAPAWLLAALRDPNLRTRSERPKRGVAGNPGEIARALSALAGLNASRATDYHGWLNVGMALHSVDEGEELLAAWDEWSKLCPEKYEDGICESKWGTFSADGGITLGSLIHWATEDGWTPPGTTQFGPLSRPGRRGSSDTILVSESLQPPVDLGTSGLTAATIRANDGSAPVANGNARYVHKLREIIRVREPRAVASLEEYREEMREARLAALTHPYHCYLDNGQTGVGKTHADTAIMAELTKEGRMSLTLVPTHKDCAAVVSQRAEQGVASVAFPHLNKETCLRYDEAEAVMAIGLSAVSALCPDCPCADSCEFQSQYKKAKEAAHTVATQARGAVDMAQLTKDRAYISIHENPLDMLRPDYLVERGLGVVELIARHAAYEASDPLDRVFYRRLEAIAKELDGWHHGSNKTCEVPLPEPCPESPRDLHRDLYAAAGGLGLVGKGPPREAMWLALAAALGKLSFIGVAVNEHPTKGGVKIVRTIIGVGSNEFPAGATVIINDATANPLEIGALLGRPIHVITPRGQLPQRHPVLQIIPTTDVTRRRSVAAVADTLRGVLHDLPQFRRVGLLTHRTLYRKVPAKLGEEYQTRLALVSYFKSGLSRGSNEWIAQCDVLIVLGTPRVGTDAIRRHLMLHGQMEAARLTVAQAYWHSELWLGLSLSGRIRAVSTWRYADADWHGAYCAIVRSELVQAIGRGRGILDKGIPVFVVSTEQICDRATQMLGPPPLADAPFAPLTVVQARALSALRGTDGEGKERTLKSETVGHCIGVKKDRAYEILHKLEQDGRVKRRGQRGGWYLPPP